MTISRLAIAGLVICRLCRKCFGGLVCWKILFATEMEDKQYRELAKILAPDIISNEKIVRVINTGQQCKNYPVEIWKDLCWRHVWGDVLYN
jgi:hypothetical protein